MTTIKVLKIKYQCDVKALRSIPLSISNEDLIMKASDLFDLNDGEVFLYTNKGNTIEENREYTLENCVSRNREKYLKRTCLTMLVKVTGGPATGSDLLAHGIQIVPTPKFHHDCYHECNHQKRSKTTKPLEVPGEQSSETPVVMYFNLDMLSRYDESSNCTGPYCLTYICTDTGPATMKIFEVVQDENGEEEKEVFSEKCEYVEGSFDEVRERIFQEKNSVEKIVIRKEYKPKDGFKPGKEYICKFLNYQRRGLRWKFRTK